MDTLSYEERLRSALLEQHERWFDYQKGAIKAEVAEAIDCPVCDSSQHSLFFVKDMFRFERCDRCAMVFLSPRLSVPATYAFYNSEWTAIYNESKFEDVSVSTELDNRVNAANLDLISRYGQDVGKSKLLEIGFGGGYFMQAARKRGYEVFGLDVDRSNYERALPLFGDHVRNSDLFDARFESAMFDVAYMRDVFEHVPNPKPMLRELNRISKPGALLFIEVPNIDGLIYKCVGKRHVVIFGFAHLNYWSPQTIGRILESTGYEVLTIAHDSSDFTLNEIVRYFLQPAFTAVDIPSQSALARFILKVIRRLLYFKWIRRLDATLTPKIADAMHRGSVIRVLARKRSAAAG